MFLEIKNNHQMSGQPDSLTNCQARNGQSDCSNACSNKETYSAIKGNDRSSRAQLKGVKKINYLVVGRGGAIMTI